MMNTPQEQPAPHEKRRHERRSCVLRLTYTLLSAEDSSPCEYGVANSKDFSQVGVCICSEHEILMNSILQLNISLPEHPYHLTVLAKALHCRRVADSLLFETGVEFVGVLPPDFERLVGELL